MTTNSFVREALDKAEADPVSYAAKELAYLMIRTGTIFILYMIARFFLLFIRFAAELIANLPFIKYYELG